MGQFLWAKSVNIYVQQKKGKQKMKKNIKNWKKAWEYFERKGYAEHDGMVLHHLDVNM